MSQALSAPTGLSTASSRFRLRFSCCLMCIATLEMCFTSASYMSSWLAIVPRRSSHPSSGRWSNCRDATGIRDCQCHASHSRRLQASSTDAAPISMPTDAAPVLSWGGSRSIDGCSGCDCEGSLITSFLETGLVPAIALRYPIAANSRTLLLLII